MSENKTEVSLSKIVQRLRITFPSGYVSTAERIERHGTWTIGSVEVESGTLEAILNQLWLKQPLSVERTMVTTVERTEELP